MRTYPHDADPSREQSSAESGPDAGEARDRGPILENDRKRSGAAIAVLLLGLAMIVLVLLL